MMRSPYVSYVLLSKNLICSFVLIIKIDYGRNDAMYAVRAVPAPVEIRTHEDGHLPSGVQPLQVALLREAFARAPHPA